MGEEGRSFWALSPRTGFTIKDQNQTRNVNDLIILTRPEAVESARYEFIELTLYREVSVTLPHLVAIVYALCGWCKGILCIYMFGVERAGFGCHMKDILTRFGLEELPCRLDVLDGPHSVTWYQWPDRRVPTSSRWDPCHHELFRWRVVSDNMMSLTLSGLALTDQDIQNLPGSLGKTWTLWVYRLMR